VPSIKWEVICYPRIPCNLYFLAIFAVIMYGVYRVLEWVPDGRIFVRPTPNMLDRLLVIEIINKDFRNDFTELSVELINLILVGHREIFFDENKSLFHVGRGNEHDRILAGKSAVISLAVSEKGMTKFLMDSPVTNNLFRKVNKPPSDISTKWKARFGGINKRAYYQFVIEISGKMGGDRISRAYKGTFVHWISQYEMQFDTILREMLSAEVQSGLNWVKWVMWLKVGKDDWNV